MQYEDEKKRFVLFHVKLNKQKEFIRGFDDLSDVCHALSNMKRTTPIRWKWQKIEKLMDKNKGELRFTHIHCSHYLIKDKGPDKRADYTQEELDSAAWKPQLPHLTLSSNSPSQGSSRP